MKDKDFYQLQVATSYIMRLTNEINNRAMQINSLEGILKAKKTDEVSEEDFAAAQKDTEEKLIVLQAQTNSIKSRIAGFQTVELAILTKNFPKKCYN